MLALPETEEAFPVALHVSNLRRVSGPHPERVDEPGLAELAPSLRHRGGTDEPPSKERLG